MELLLHTIIYLIAVFGIIFTTMTFIEMYNYRNIQNSILRTYMKNKVNKESEKNKREIEVIVNISGLSNKEEKEVIDKIKKGEYEDIYEVVDIVKINKR